MFGVEDLGFKVEDLESEWIVGLSQASNDEDPYITKDTENRYPKPGGSPTLRPRPYNYPPYRRTGPQIRGSTFPKP